MTRLIEQVDQNTGDLGNLRNALTRLECIEDQNSEVETSVSRCVGDR